MKKLFLSLLLAPAFALAQGPPALMTPVPFGSYGFINGKTLFNRSDLNEEGSYTFPKVPVNAKVTLRNGREYPSVKTMVNLMDNEMIFSDSTGQAYSAIVPISSIEFAPSENVPSRTVFKTGFPSIDGNDENTFYEVLAEGQLTLLRHNKVTYVDKSVLGRSMPTRVYDDKQTLYVYNSKDDSIKKIHRNETQELFAGNTKMKSYLGSHKVKSDADLAGVITYYNSAQ